MELITLNIWKYILFYIYSGIALGGLCAGRARELTEYVPPTSSEEGPANSLQRRNNMFDDVCNTAMKLGDTMSDATTTAITGSYNSQLIQHYEDAKAHNEQALRLVPPANNQGA